MSSGYVGAGGRERERQSLKGEHGRGSYVDIGGGEHVALGSHFHSPFVSSLASLLSALVNPQRWLFCLGLA